MGNKTLKIFPAQTDKDFEIAKKLFVGYADSLGFDLAFQDFQQELDNLAEYYNLPDNCLMLVKYKGQIVGCVGLKRFSDEICEMKRLYVRPQFQGLGIGRALAQAVIEQARKIGYTHMRLDFIAPRVSETLYKSLGFTEIAPYEDIPIAGSKFMELKLA